MRAADSLRGSGEATKAPAHAHHRAAHEFSPEEARQARRLRLVILLIAAFFVLELAGALAAGSVVLQADALHLLMDVLALGISFFAMRLAVRRPTPRFTYGLRRAEPVAALFSAALVLVTTAFIVIEAIEALDGEAQPRPGIMVAVASMALLVNGLSAWLLHDVMGHAGSSHAHDSDPCDDPAHPRFHPHRLMHAHAHAKRGGHALNLRGAWLHLVGDTLAALAALVAALVVRYGGRAAADPIAGFVVAAILVFGALRLAHDATLVLLEAAPAHLPVEVIRDLVVTTPGVVGVHNLHVWTLGAGHDAITVHVRSDSVDPAFGQRLSDHLRSTLGAEYVTVQVESVATASEEP